MERRKFKLATLGCRTNQYETQGYRDQLLALGFEEAKEGETADYCIINTCTVTEGADRSSRHQIREMIREHPHAKVAVTGCMVEAKPKLNEEIGGIFHVVPNKEKEKLVQYLFPDEEMPEFSIKNFEGHTRAFVKVQDGCNSFCTYCIIPYVRGRSRSKTIAEVVKEVKDLIAAGYQEIVLTGINVGDFDGGGENKRLGDLIREVDQLEGLKRLRLSSIDPDEVDDDLADAILNGKTTCPSMHIVLQSGSNVVLKRMNRKYTKQIFLDTCQRLRQASPDFTFTTDVIVGFPGETEGDFNETLEIIEEVGFAKVHMFPYSKRERTRAALYPNQVPQEVITARKREVIRRSEEVAFHLRARYVGRRMAVLTENGDKEHSFGHTDNFLGVSIPASLQPNQLIEVTLVDNTPAGLVGVP